MTEKSIVGEQQLGEAATAADGLEGNARSSWPARLAGSRGPRTIALVLVGSLAFAGGAWLVTEREDNEGAATAQPAFAIGGTEVSARDIEDRVGGFEVAAPER